MTRFDWWSSDRPHEVLVEAARWIANRDVSRKEIYLRSARLYGGLAMGEYTDRRFDVIVDHLGLNVVKAAVQAVVASLIRSLPRSRVLTTGGNWSLRRRARLLERFLEGQRHANGVREIAGEVALDFALLGTGVVKVYPDAEKKRVCIDHVHPGEVFVDHLESIYRRPQTLYHRKYVNREVLADMFPEHAAVIQLAETARHPSVSSDTTAEVVEVWESWRLGSRHVIAIDRATLLDEPWEEDVFPFVFCRWDITPYNFWGDGLGEQLTGIQVEINRVLQKIQKSLHRLSVPRVFVEAGSKIQKAQLNNAIGAIVTYTGQKPIIESPQTVHPELFRYLWDLYGKAFEIAGIGQLSASGVTPSGLQSGQAIREWADTQSARFARVFADWEDFWVRVDEATICAGKRLSKTVPNFSTVAPRDKWTTSAVRWKDVDMKRDAYVLRCYPASSLPSLPAGKLAFVGDLMNLGIVSAEEGKQLLDFPDLEAHMALDRAAYEAIESAIETMLDDGEYVPPEPFFDLALALKICQSSYLRAKSEGAPEDRLALLRDFAVDCKRLIDTVSEAHQRATTGLEQEAVADGEPPAAV